MNDCHRGIRDEYDNFIKNKNIYQYALNYYYYNDFSYFELGGGDEMREILNCDNIIIKHLYLFIM